MSEFISANLPYLLAGISVGGQYALIAIGYTMVYGILRLINFAHGDVFMVAGLVMVYATASLPIYVSTFYAEGGDPDFEAGIKEWINADEKNLSNNGGNDMLAAVTVMGYDAYFTALEAIQAAGSTDPAAVLEALPGVTYEGVSGQIAFDDIGDAIRDSAFVKTANTAEGVWDFVKVQGVE